MRKKIREIILILLILVFVVPFASCSDSDSTDSQNNSNVEQKSEDDENEEKGDSNLTENLTWTEGSVDFSSDYAVYSFIAKKIELYTIFWDNASESSDSLVYSDDILMSAYYVNSKNETILLFENADNGYKNGKEIRVSDDCTIYLKAIAKSDSASYVGNFRIAVKYGNESVPLTLKEKASRFVAKVADGASCNEGSVASLSVQYFSNSSFVDVSNSATFSCSDTDIIAVLKSNLLCKSAGKANIKISYNGDSCTIPVTVQDSACPLVIKIPESANCIEGESFSLSATYNGDDVTANTNWTNGDSSIKAASITSGGLVKCLAEGTAYIFAEYGNEKAFTILDVKFSPVYTITSSTNISSLNFSRNGDFTIIVKGSFTSSKLTTLATKLQKAASTFKYELDLSNMIGITEIPNQTFYACKGMTKLSLPEGITAIWKSAFYNCTALEKLYLPASLKNLYSNCFDFCPITEIYFAGTLKEYFLMSKDYTWINDSASYDLYIENELISDVTVPSTISYVPTAIFEYCKSITSCNLHSSVTSIGKSAFEGAVNLSSLNNMTALKSIESLSFSKTAITSITFPSTLYKIDSYAFSDSSLKFAYFEESGRWVFDYSKNDYININANGRRQNYVEELTKTYVGRTWCTLEYLNGY